MDRRVDKIVRDIKSLKIQGARSIAKSALYAYSLSPDRQTKEKLINSRPTEPMLAHSIESYEQVGYKKTIEHFNQAQDRINKLVLKLIKTNSTVFTHCHSTNVILALIYAHKKGKKFQVYNTETRPLFQGRKTALELKKAGIKVTMFVDSASRVALEKDNRKDRIHADIVFLGADAILPSGIVNKIGSGMIAELAYDSKIPVYIIADSWKFAKQVKIESRDTKEIWAVKKLKIKNPVFEFVPEKYITAVVSELGILSLAKFVKKAKN